MKGKNEQETQITQEDLDKSLDKLHKSIENDDTTSRKDELLAKAQNEDLKDDERDELFSLLGGQKVEKSEKENLGEELIKSMQSNETISDALEVSAYLDEQHKELCKSLQHLGEVFEQSETRQHEYNLVLGRAVSDIGKMVKSLHETIEQISGRPARPPKSKGVAPMAKSFAGAPATEDQLSRGEILSTLDRMMEKSMDSGREGVSPGGNRIDIETAKYETSGHLSKSMYQEVQQFKSAQ